MKCLVEKLGCIVNDASLEKFIIISQQTIDILNAYGADEIYAKKVQILLDDLKSSGIYDKIDVLYIPMLANSLGNACVNAIDLTKETLSPSFWKLSDGVLTNADAWTGGSTFEVVPIEELSTVIKNNDFHFITYNLPSGRIITGIRNQSGDRLELTYNQYEGSLGKYATSLNKNAFSISGARLNNTSYADVDNVTGVSCKGNGDGTGVVSMYKSISDATVTYTNEGAFIGNFGLGNYNGNSAGINAKFISIGKALTNEEMNEYSNIIKKFVE